MKTVKINLPMTELLAQLAEEAAELAQAALKLRRALGAKNPTPKTPTEAYSELVGELSDVALCARQLDLTPDEELINQKLLRWERRLNAIYHCDG